jgi:D-3-phosphoglycerate dehydrogenase
MKQKILIVQPIHERGIQVFDDRFEVRVASDPSVATVIKEIRGVAGVVVRTAPFPREIIEAADALRVIGRHGVGVDNIDVKAATAKGIVVVNTPNANATSVAEHTLTAIGALAKHAVVYDRATREGRWEIRNSYKAVDLDGKILGLVGIGRIGSMVARRAAAAYNMKVIAFDPYIRPDAASEMGVSLCAQMDDVFRPRPGDSSTRRNSA